MDFNILYADENVLVIDKVAGIDVDNLPRRVHRLDKDTSGILLVANNDKTLEFLQNQLAPTVPHLVKSGQGSFLTDKVRGLLPY